MNWSYRFERKLQDAWVGAFWKRTHVDPDIWVLDLWICLLPCLPLHLTFTGYEARQ